MKPGESPKAAPDTRQTGVAVGVCVLAGIGFIMSIQPVSLLTGTGTVWLGIAIIGIGVALAYFFGARKWVRIVAIIVLALALFNGCAVEHRIADKRAGLSRSLSR